MGEEEKGRVCVTGAGGFIASWLVKLLLSRHYLVNGTVRDPGDEKYAHLTKLENSSENLKLFKADLLDYSSLCAAFKGCIGVFHIASPVQAPTSLSDPETEFLEPAIRGTRNVLNACSEANIKRVVVVSSISAVIMNPSWPKDQPKDETSWSDMEYCRGRKIWYFVSKTEAEKEAVEFGQRTGIEILSICPSLVLGPMLQSTVNYSSVALINLVKEGTEILGRPFWSVVDVRDLAKALLLLYEKPEAEGRYICSSHRNKVWGLVEILKQNYPNYNYPTSFKDGAKMDEFNCEKLQKLGWSCRPLEETLTDSIESYKRLGILE